MLNSLHIAYSTPLPSNKLDSSGLHLVCPFWFLPAVDDNGSSVWNATLSAVDFLQEPQDPTRFIWHAVVRPAQVLVMPDVPQRLPLQEMTANGVNNHVLCFHLQFHSRRGMILIYFLLHTDRCLFRLGHKTPNTPVMVRCKLKKCWLHKSINNVGSNEIGYLLSELNTSKVCVMWAIFVLVFAWHVKQIDLNKTITFFYPKSSNKFKTDYWKSYR